MFLLVFIVLIITPHGDTTTAGHTISGSTITGDSDTCDLDSGSDCGTHQEADTCEGLSCKHYTKTDPPHSPHTSHHRYMRARSWGPLLSLLSCLQRRRESEGVDHMLLGGVVVSRVFEL